MADNYEVLLNKAARVSGLEKEELERRVEAKRAKLAGLISREGAMQVIVAELGLNFDGDKLKINELATGMRKVNIVGKIIRVFPVRTFTTKNGEPGKVSNLVVADETSNIKVVLWDTNHVELIETGSIGEGSVVEIVNAMMRDNEIHLGNFSELKLSKEEMGEVKTEQIVREKKISEFRIGESLKVRAFVVQVFEPRFFYVCSECKKKVVSGSDGFICAEHQKVIPEKRALVNIVLDDGTETMRAVVFNDHLSGLGLNDLEDTEKLSYQKENLLGKEMLFIGNVRNNKFFNNTEFVVNDVSEANIDEILKVLEKK